MDKTDWQDTRSLSPRGYARTIAALGLNQSSAARYLGVSPRTGRRYVEGTARVPVATVLLLSALLMSGTKPLVPKRPKPPPKP